MKAQLLGREKPFDGSFRAVKHSYPYFLNVWHYHSELELVYIVQSTGTRFIGDSTEQFKEGDLVLIGENLPHLWQNDAHYFAKGANLKAEALSIHFNKDFGGKDFCDIPEMQLIKSLINRAAHGLLFRGEICGKAVGKMNKVIRAEGIHRIVILLELLEKLARAEYEPLSSEGFTLPIQNSGDDRIAKVYSFTYENFKQDISLEEVAALVNLNPSAFCRFFKKSAKKSYFSFLNEIRIGYACKLLLEEKQNISEVAYTCGYNNLSHFNRQFKMIKHHSPSAFLAFHKGIA